MLALVIVAPYVIISSWSRNWWNEAVAQYERDVGSLDLRRWEVPDVPPERNAATWIARGAAALAIAQDGRDASKVRAAIRTPPAAWSSEDLAALRAAIEAGRDALDVLAGARYLEESSFGIRLREGAAGTLPDLLQILNAAEMVYARGTLALRDGDRAAALADHALLGKIAGTLEQEATSLVTLVGLGVERRQLRLAQGLVQDFKVTLRDLDGVQTHVLRNEVRALYARSLAADGAVLCSDLRDRGLGFKLSSLRIIAGDVLGACCLESYRTILPTLDSAPFEMEQRYHDVLAGLRESWRHRVVSEHALPGPSGAIQAWTSLELRRLTLTAVWLRSHALVTGTYPADLGRLSTDPSPEPQGPGAWSYEQLANGAVRLSAPKSETLAWQGLTRREDLTFVWTLPP